MEIRLYAFAILLSALLLLSFFDGYLTEVPQTKARWCYVLFSVLALYTQYYLGFLLVANASALLVLRRWYALRSYLFGIIVVGLCFAPMLMIIPYQVSTHTQPVASFAHTPTIFKEFKYILKIAVQYTLLVIKSTSLACFRIIYVPYFFVGSKIFYLKNCRLITVNNIAIVTINFILFICFSFLNLIGAAVLVFRHTAVYFLPRILSVFTVVKGIHNKNALLIWTVVTIFFYSTFLYNTYKPMAKVGDWERVASYIMAAEKPSQAILVFDSEVAMNLAYYYSGLNAIVPIPKELDFQTYNVRDFVLRNEKEILTALLRVPGEHQFIWLVNQFVA